MASYCGRMKFIGVQEMRKGFDGAKFVKDIGILLVHAYDGARRATTPGLVGSAIENPVRTLLATVLPSGLSVGTGCVVDSYGTASRQMDIVLYERDICPVYRVNDTPEATYFPCEGVVAVGEIKATIDGSKLEDSFDKIQSVKILRRNWEQLQSTVPKEKNYRNYGSTVNFVGIRSENENEERERNEVFGFVLAGSSKLRPESLIQRYENRARKNGSGTCPNVLATMDGAYVRPFISDKPGHAIPKRSFHTGDRVGYYDGAESFRILVDDLNVVYRSGHTAPLEAFRSYLVSSEDSQPKTLRAHGVMRSP